MTNEQAFAVIEARGWILGPLFVFDGDARTIAAWCVYASWEDVEADMPEAADKRAIGKGATIADAVAVALVARRSE